MFYIVACDYVDADNSINTDPTAGVFTTIHDAHEFAYQLADAGWFHINVTECDHDPTA